MSVNNGGFNRPLISTCLILKNEGETIYETLKSVWDVTDHYVIGVDESTEDNTSLEVARFMNKYPGGDYTYYTFKWENDFSKARNEGFDKAKGDYILIMDGHERLTNNRINDIELDKDVYLFEIEMHSGQHRTRFQQARLFKKGYKMHNACHNVLIYKDEDSAKLMDTVIVHERSKELSDARVEQRKEMNIPDLELRLLKGDRRALSQIAHEYFSYRIWDKAIEYLNLYLKEEMHEAERYHVLIKLGMAYYHFNKMLQAQETFMSCDKVNFDNRNAHYVFLAELLAKYGSYESAKKYAEKALAVKRPNFFYHLYPDFYYKVPLKILERIKNDTN